MGAGLSGVPMVLITSLNVMGEPIRHSVGDALEAFPATHFDAVVIEHLLIARNAEVLATALRTQGGIERA